MEIIRKIVREELARIHEKVSPRALANDKFEEKFGEMELIAQTQTGTLYRDKSGAIAKLTSDETEYENAVTLIKKPHKNFIKYYSAEPLEVESGLNWYILVMEEIKELNDDEWAIVDMINNTLGMQEYMLDDQRRYAFINELKRNPEWYEGITSYKEVISILQSIYGMYKEADRRGITLHDVRAQNIGRTMDGRLVHFDLGAG